MLDHLSPNAKGLLRQLLEKDPEKRLTIDQAIKHPWLMDIRFFSLLGMNTKNTMDKEMRRGLSEFGLKGRSTQQLQQKMTSITNQQMMINRRNIAASKQMVAPLKDIDLEREIALAMSKRHKKNAYSI